MAQRPVFIPDEIKSGVHKVSIEFPWAPGFAPSQKKKNVAMLHQSARARGIQRILEVSTKSEERTGYMLSAFNLKIKTRTYGEIAFESAFQGSKVFEFGGPYTDLYNRKAIEAKKDPRLKESGKLIGFNFEGKMFGIYPETLFYDWLYAKAFREVRGSLAEDLMSYSGFSDIEFNPKVSINCQAHSCALIVSLLKNNLFDEAIESQEDFAKVAYNDFKLVHASRLKPVQTALHFA